VSGIDFDAEAADRARPDLEEVVVADLDGTRLSDHFPKDHFDVIVFADVLEHQMDPVATLADAVALLRPEGRVVVSIPNVTHGSVRLALLQGRWRYTDTGLLARTHIRFFDRAGFVQMFADAGYHVEDLRATVADPLRSEVEADGVTLPSSVVEWVRDQEDAFVYQFVASARPGVVDDPAPELVPAADVGDLRLDDFHAHKARAEAEAARNLAHTLMTLRDNAVGLEAAAASARQRQVRAEQRANRAEAKVVRLEKRVKGANRRTRKAEVAADRARRQLRQSRRQSTAELEAIRSSRTWRAGRMLVSPFSALRRGKG
jgi:SAM-dependent methyltransferase